MDTKLTLKLDNNVIERAKYYAKQKHTSLSMLVETYLNYLTTSQIENEEVTPLVKSLSGVIQLPKNFDHKKDYKKHIANKYTR